MGVIWTPQKTLTRQPQGFARVSDSPLTRDMVFCWSAGAKRAELLSGKAADQDNTAGVAFHDGLSARCATGQANIQWASTEFCKTSDGAGTGDFTFAILANPSSKSTLEHGIAQKNDAGGSPFSQAVIFFNAQAGANVSAGKAAFFTFSSAASDVATSSLVVNGSWRFFVGVRRGSVHQIWIDGNLEASASRTVRNILQSGSPRYTEIGSRGNGTSESYSGDAALGLMYDRALDPKEIQSLSQNPWQIFQAPVNRTIFLPQVATGTPTLTPKITGITATSAVPVIDVTF